MLGGISRRRASIVEAGVSPVVALVLGAVGVLSDEVAVTGLHIWARHWLCWGRPSGVVFAQVERLRPLRALLAVGANLALGLVLIGLKVFVVH